MRVLHVIPSVGPARGGPSVAVRLMAEACVRAGAQVDVATTNDNERTLLDVPLGSRQETNGVGYHYFARDLYRYTISRGLGRWLPAQVTNYDVVHIHALFSYASTMAGRSARAARVPYIIRPLGTLAPYGMAQHRLLKRISWLLFERGMIEHAAAVHFTSAAEAAEAALLSGGTRGIVIPLGIDVGAYTATRDRSWLEQVAPHMRDATVFLFLSRIHPKKRLETVLHALAALRLQGVAAVLVVAGTGAAEYVGQVRRLTHQLDLESAVFWAGHLSGDAKAAALRAADAFVLPSINENFGISVVEALASALPVVITRGVAIHTEVARANAGLVVADSAPDLAMAMRRLCQPAERNDMAGHARALAQRAFSIEAMGASLMQLYERIAA